jgi:hypothetical protein
VYLNLSFEIRGECARKAHQENSQLRRSLRVTEHSGGEDCAAKARGEDKTTKGSIKLCQEGIEHMHIVHKRDSISSSK